MESEREPLKEFLRRHNERFGKLHNYGYLIQKALTNARYPCVDFSLTEHTADEKDYWSTMHSWCRCYFNDAYTWTGHLFWFEREDHAYFFKVQWVFGVMAWAGHFPYTIRAIPEEHTQHWQTDRVLDVANELRSKYNVTLDCDSFLNGRWLGLQNDTDAMYARLLLPNHEFVDLRSYGPPLNAPE